MKKRTLQQLAIAYLAIPIVLFFFGWLRFPLAIVASGLVLWAAWHTCKQTPAEAEASNAVLFDRKQILLLLLICGTWTFASGIGGFTYQNPDFHCRNAVFRDLIVYNWPVVYPSSPETFLLYYHAFWLPAALVGKLAGWQVANFALFLWTILGLLIVFGLITMASGKFRYFSIFIFLLFSGLDELGCLINFGHFPGVLAHTEWWCRPCQYSSMTTCLFWVFNQALPAWVATLLVLNAPLRTLGFSSCLIIPFAPLPALGLSVITCARFIDHKRTMKIAWSQAIRQVLPLHGTLGALVIISIFYVYFSGNQGIKSLSGPLFTAKNITYMAPVYLKFISIEVLLLLAFFWRQLRWDWTLGTSVVSLVSIPLYIAGGSNDFCMRASIPALAILAVAIGQAFHERPHEETPRILYIRKACQIGLLIVSWTTPLHEICRSVYCVNRFGPYQADLLKTLAPRSDEREIANPNFVCLLPPDGDDWPWLFKYRPTLSSPKTENPPRP